MKKLILKKNGRRQNNAKLLIMQRVKNVAILSRDNQTASLKLSIGVLGVSNLLKLNIVFCRSLTVCTATTLAIY